MMNPAAPGQAMTPAPGQAPISPDKIKMLELPTWEEVEALLANPVLREFRLDIETDSTIKMDEEAEKKARMELIKAASDFITQMVTAGATAPEILPMLGELLMFGIRAFKTARSVEQTFEDMMEALNKAAKQPKPPDPKILEIQTKAQTDMAIADKKAQLDKDVAMAQQQAQGQQEAQSQQLEAQREQHKATLDAQLEQHKASIQAHSDMVIQELKNQFEAQRTQFEEMAKARLAVMEGNVKIKVAEISAKAQKERQAAEHKHEKSMPQPAAGARKKKST